MDRGGGKKTTKGRVEGECKNVQNYLLVLCSLDTVTLYY